MERKMIPTRKVPFTHTLRERQLSNIKINTRKLQNKKQST